MIYVKKSGLEYKPYSQFSPEQTRTEYESIFRKQPQPQTTLEYIKSWIPCVLFLLAMVIFNIIILIFSFYFHTSKTNTIDD